MAKKPVKVRDLLRLTRLADDCAKVLVEYLDGSHLPHDIAETFSRIFYQRFRVHLTPEIAAKLPRHSYHQPPVSQDEGVQTIALEMAGAFMEVVTNSMKEES